MFFFFSAMFSAKQSAGKNLFISEEKSSQSTENIPLFMQVRKTLFRRQNFSKEVIY